MDNLSNLKTLVTGGVGMSASVGVEQIGNISTVDISEGASLLTQIVILVVTLIGLFRKKKQSTIKI